MEGWEAVHRSPKPRHVLLQVDAGVISSGGAAGAAVVWCRETQSQLKQNRCDNLSSGLSINQCGMLRAGRAAGRSPFRAKKGTKQPHFLFRMRTMEGWEAVHRSPKPRHVLLQVDAGVISSGGAAGAAVVWCRETQSLCAWRVSLLSPGLDAVAAEAKSLRQSLEWFVDQSMWDA